jgi:hypothetical protein
MLNVIDFVYSDCPPVREAWADLYIIFNTADMHQQLREEKTRVLLKSMAAELGLTDMKIDDLGRVYYPNSIAKQMEIQMLQQDLSLKTLRAQAGGAVAPGGVGDPGPKFPPVPGGSAPSR